MTKELSPQRKQNLINKVNQENDIKQLKTLSSSIENLTPSTDYNIPILMNKEQTISTLTSIIKEQLAKKNYEKLIEDAQLISQFNKEPKDTYFVYSNNNVDYIRKDDIENIKKGLAKIIKNL